MKHTLIPIEQKISLRKEYDLRLAVVVLFMFSAACFLGILSLFPTLLHVTVVEHDTQVSSQSQSSDEYSAAEIQAMLAADRNLLSVVPDKAPGRFSYLIDDISRSRGPIKVLGISFARAAVDPSLPSGSARGLTVIIRGISPTRDELVNFKNRLASLWKGSVIDLPLSELTKNANIPFSLTVNTSLL